MTTRASAGATMANGEAIAIDQVPVLATHTWRNAVVDGAAGGGRMVSLFGTSRPNAVRAYAVLAFDAEHRLTVLATDLREAYPALTPDCPQAHLFERELHEKFGVIPHGHPWLKPVRTAHEPDSDYPFFAMTGTTVHEVAVGPVHAGVIEPGHFRFQCDGETVHHLEIQLGYQHRGVEEALVGGPHPRTPLLIETVAGDTTIANATAYAQLEEGLAGVEPPPRAQALRAVGLELERVANHIGDLGALAGDVGYLPTAAYAGRLRGDFLNMTTQICGSRMGRNWVRMGGVAFDVDDAMRTRLLDALSTASRDAAEAMDLYFTSGTVQARLHGTGTVSRQTARDLGLVGPAGRASGVATDVRSGQPTGWFREQRIESVLGNSGDVYARSLVRKLEIERSFAFLRRTLEHLPDGPISVPCATSPSSPRLAVSLVEAWRGETAHTAITDERGRFERYKLVDPSFHNWTGLAMALRGQPISDFPLCNKSFNLSYCGFDQ